MFWKNVHFDGVFRFATRASSTSRCYRRRWVIDLTTDCLSRSLRSRRERRRVLLLFRLPNHSHGMEPLEVPSHFVFCFIKSGSVQQCWWWRWWGFVYKHDSAKIATCNVYGNTAVGNSLWRWRAVVDGRSVGGESLRRTRLHGLMWISSYSGPVKKKNQYEFQK